MSERPEWVTPAWEDVQSPKGARVCPECDDWQHRCEGCGEAVERCGDRCEECEHWQNRQGER